MKLTDSNRSGRFVITGTSGTGKTRLVESLRARGHVCFEEPVRRTLMDQLAVDGPALPAKDPLLFVREMLRLCLANLETSRVASGPVFFDRGIPDLVAYAGRFGVDASEFESAARNTRYETTVFVVRPWREIFVNDEVRRGTFEVYAAFHERIEQAYRELGYQLVEVPKVDVEARASFIEEFAGAARRSGP